MTSEEWDRRRAVAIKAIPVKDGAPALVPREWAVLTPEQLAAIREAHATGGGRPVHVVNAWSVADAKASARGRRPLTPEQLQAAREASRRDQEA